MAISSNSNCFLMVIERGLSQRLIIKTKENVPIQPQQVHKVYSERNKTDTNYLTDDTRDSSNFSADHFFLIFVKIDI